MNFIPDYFHFQFYISKIRMHIVFFCISRDAYLPPMLCYDLFFFWESEKKKTQILTQVVHGLDGKTDKETSSYGICATYNIRCGYRETEVGRSGPFAQAVGGKASEIPNPQIRKRHNMEDTQNICKFHVFKSNVKPLLCKGHQTWH